MAAEAEAGARRPQAPSGGETQEEPSSGACGRRLSRQDLDLGLPLLHLGVPFGCCKPPACGPWSGPPRDVATACRGPHAQPSPKGRLSLRRPWGQPPEARAEARPALTLRLSAMMTTLGSVRALSSCLVARFFSWR